MNAAPFGLVNALVFVMASLAVVAAEEARPLTTSAESNTGYASVNGLKMYYEISGTGSPAVFIHPALSQGRMACGLTANRRWIVMDLQGHGRTADIDRPMTCDQHAEDVAALLKQLDISKADIFGDSFGGAIAVTLALQHPELVRRVVCYGNTFTPFPKEIASVISPESDLIRWEREEYRRVAPDPEHWPILVAKAMKCGREWKGISSDQLQTITSPVLIACGDHDLVPLERCAELSRLIPHGQLAIIPDASHFVIFSEPGKLLPVISAFFDAPVSTVPLATAMTGYYPGTSR